MHVHVTVLQSFMFYCCTCKLVIATISNPVYRSLGEWHTLVGEGGERPLQVTYERDSGMDVTNPKHGKVGGDTGSIRILIMLNPFYPMECITLHVYQLLAVNDHAQCSRFDLSKSMGLLPHLTQICKRHGVVITEGIVM